MQAVGHRRQEASAVALEAAVGLSLLCRAATDPMRTSIIENDFDFLGYHFSRQPLQVAEKTVEKHVLQIIQLYEQLRKKKATPNEVASSLGLYVKRWQRWAVAGLPGGHLSQTNGIFRQPISGASFT